MRHAWTQLILWISLTLAAASPHAENLRIVAEYWPPYVDKAAKGHGLAIDLVTTALTRARYDYSIDYQPWPRALEGGKIGVYDLIANIWYSSDRAKDLDYSEPYLVNDIRLVKRKNSDIKFRKMSDLSGLMVGVVKDYAYPKEFAAASNIIKIDNADLLPALGGLIKGDYDLVIGDLNALNYLFLKFLPNESTQLEILPKSVGLSKLYVAASKSNPKHARIIKDFNEALRSIQKDGTYQSIIETHQADAP
ncbi:substrate-binding periplasmic protein [Methyloterricola oryzae]|uniref:substrate-binding periplasmic protein n=1 Tax=Methyloterricola oryzae TaxID=1495050 RepID=UPI0005EB344F|nr:transporter substrate-binding domain-containing protein [Methyloterricola oryzae]